MKESEFKLVKYLQTQANPYAKLPVLSDEQLEPSEYSAQHEKGKTKVNAQTLNDQILANAIKNNAAAFCCRRRLQPGGGAGDKVFPPTFAGAVYAVEQRLQVDFTPWSPTGDVEADKNANRLIDAVEKITSLQVPHRLADAILRDCEVEEDRDGKKLKIPFRQSAKGRALNTVKLFNATALYQLCPTALVFGMWDSTGPKGGLGAKFERALVSEVIVAESARRMFMGIYGQRFPAPDGSRGYSAIFSGKGADGQPLPARASAKAAHGNPT